MKIATLTYHRAVNYGSVLQTYALSKYFRNLRNGVVTIDYSSPKQIYQKFEPVKFGKKGLMAVARNGHTALNNVAIERKCKRNGGGGYKVVAK